MPTARLLPLPQSDTRYVTEIGDDDLLSKNDAAVLVFFDANVTGLTIGAFTVTAEDADGNDISDAVSVVDDSLEGENSVYRVKIRPPDTDSGTLTLALAEDAVAEGNDAVSRTLAFTDAEKETDWDLLFSTDVAYTALLESRPGKDGYIRLVSADGIDTFTNYDTPFSTDYTRSEPVTELTRAIPFGNGGYLNFPDNNIQLLDSAGDVVWTSDRLQKIYDNDGIRDLTFKSVALTSKGTLLLAIIESGGTHDILEYTLAEISEAIADGDTTLSTDKSSTSFFNGEIEVENWTGNLRIGSDLDTGKIYISDHEKVYTYDADRNIIESEVLTTESGEVSVFIGAWGGDLYRFTADGDLYRMGTERLSQPMPREVIHPLFIAPGEKFDLTTLIPNFEKGVGQVVFDVGFDKEAWFEIVDDRYIRVEDDYEDDAALILKLLAINANGFVPFSFYVIVNQTRTPQWLRFSMLCVDATKPLNLLDYVLDADRVLWKREVTPPTGVTLDDSVITIASTVTDPIEVELTAWNGNKTADHSFKLIPIQDIEIPTGIKRFKVYIEGIDVSQDLIEVPTLSKSLDAIKVDVYTVSSSEIVLNNRHGRYNYRIDGNFWEQNTLNPYGYLNSIEIYIEVSNEIDYNPGTPSWMSYLLFQGVIVANTDPLSEVRVRLKATDISYHLRNANMNLNRFGVHKAAETVETTNFGEVEGIYALQEAMQPALAEDVTAWSDRREITLKDTANPTVSARKHYTGYLTESGVLTEGGRLDARVLMRYKTPHRNIPAIQALHYLSKTDRIYTVSADIHIPEVDEAFFSPRGNIAYDTEDGRTERVPVDWIYDRINKQMYILLSAPDTHIGGSRLVRVDYVTGRSVVLYEFERGRTAWQLASEDFDTFYILTSASSRDDMDRSASDAPRDTQCTAYAYDSAAPESDTRIIRYHKSFDDTTDFIDADYPPQVGCHYSVGFGNAHYLNPYQGIVAHTRSRFVAVNGSLYYRYATDSEFGVAKAPADGAAVTALFTETGDAFFNHLNFAFDIDSTGDVYMASVQGTEGGSTLKIEKYVAGGDNAVIFAKTESLGGLTDIDSRGGAFLGVQELVVSGDHFYHLVSVSRDGRRWDVSAAGAIYDYYGLKHRLLTHSDFIHWGPCALTLVSDGIVYFAETPQYAYKLLPIHPDLESYDVEAGYNILDTIGDFKCIEAGNVLRDLGNIYAAGDPVHGIFTRGIETDAGSIDFIVGSGNPDGISQSNSPLASLETQQWVSYTKRLHYYLHQMPTTGSPYEAIVNLASRMNAVFSIDKGVIRLQDNQPYSARLTGTIGATVPYAGANKTFPDSGYLLIDGEILKYEAKTDTEFRTLTRGVQGSLHTSAGEGTEFLKIDKLIDTSAFVDEIFQTLQLSQIYNQVTDAENRVRTKDADALETYGERSFTISVSDLTSNDVAWLAWLAAVYLNRLSDINNRIRLKLANAEYLNIGDIVTFHYKNIFLVPIRIIELEYEGRVTSILGKQVKPTGVVPAEPALPAGETYRTLDGVGDPIFIDGLGDHTIFAGDESVFERGQINLRFESTDIPNQIFDENVPIPPLQLPKARVDDAGTEPDEVVYTLAGSLAGLAFDAGACTLSGFPNTALVTTALTYTATYEGESVTLTFNIEVNADTSGSFLTLDGFGDPILVDGTGDRVIFNG